MLFHKKEEQVSNHDKFKFPTLDVSIPYKHVTKANQNLAILRKVAFQGIEKSPVSYAS
jgi:hypothetical protein